MISRRAPRPIGSTAITMRSTNGVMRWVSSAVGVAQHRHAADAVGRAGQAVVEHAEHVDARVVSAASSMSRSACAGRADDDDVGRQAARRAPSTDQGPPCSVEGDQRDPDRRDPFHRNPGRVVGVVEQRPDDEGEPPAHRRARRRRATWSVSGSWRPNRYWWVERITRAVTTAPMDTGATNDN